MPDDRADGATHATGSVSRNGEFPAAAGKAAAERASVHSRIAAQDKPYIVDTWGGFEVEMDADEGERRFFEVVVERGVFSVSLVDTKISGTLPVDHAKIGAWTETDITGLSSLMEREANVRLRFEQDGLPLQARVIDDVLFAREADGTRLYITFHPQKGRSGSLFIASRKPGEKGEEVGFTDWIDTADYLRDRGILIRAEAAEPVPSPGMR